MRLRTNLLEAGAAGDIAMRQLLQVKRGFSSLKMTIWVHFFAAGLQAVRRRAENGAVRAGKRFAVFAAAMLGICLLGTAQYQDRDTRGVPKTSEAAPPPAARIDINHAGVDELLKVPGMTRSWAGRIVRFRPYRTKQDLLERGVVTGQVYDRIKDYVIAHQKAQ
jgi:DNA uptake protein ComE-like DNA-binding protein